MPVDNAKLNLAYCHIVSPIDGPGRIAPGRSGNYVQTASTTGIVVITQMQPISVLFSVPEDNLPDIIQRVRAGATLQRGGLRPVQHQAAGDGTAWRRVDNQIDTTTGTLKLRADVRQSG